MKIDFVISALSGGGAERVMVILANSFAEKEYHINLITLNEKPDGDAYDLSEKITRLKLHNGKFKNHKLRSLNSLFQHYKSPDNRPDVLISFLTFTNLVSILAARLRGIKIIASEHINHLESEHPHYLTKITRKFIYPLADIITVLTKFDIDFYKKNNSNVVVMPNPCTFNPIKRNDHKRLPEIIAVGSLDRYHHKGFDNLIDLITPVLTNNHHWKLKILGGGKRGDKILKNLISARGMESQIELCGFQKNVSEFMKTGSIFILPSRFEGLPMVLLEAMSQGMACIAYDCKTGPSDIISNNLNGILVENQNKKAMQEKLEVLINSEELRMQISSNALQSLDKYSVDTITSKWIQLFEKLER